MRRLPLILLLAFLAVLATTAPATLIDSALQHATQGRLRLADARGSLWHGSGQLAAPAGDRLLAPWLALRWDFDGTALMRGRAGWRLSADGQHALRLALGRSGWQAQELDLQLPLEPVLQALPHPALQFGWRGRIAARGARFGCSWQGACTGELTLEWRGAATDVLPEHRLGDYHGELRASEDALALALSSAAGNALRLDGNLALRHGGKPAAELRIGGEPAIVERLPGVLHGRVRRTATGDLLLRWP